jgi:hypothetical protein
VEWPLSEYKSHLHTRKFIFRIVMYEDGWQASMVRSANN